MKEKGAQILLSKGKYKEAAKVLDQLLASDNMNGELWYLRGVASMKMKNYDAAQEYFEKALFSEKKAKYYQMKGMSHFEIFELNEAIADFQHALDLEPANAIANFFIAVCFILMDDPRSTEYIKKAKEVNPKQTKQLLLNFYKLFLEDDPNVSDVQKSKIAKRIEEL